MASFDKKCRHPGELIDKLMNLLGRVAASLAVKINNKYTPQKQSLLIFLPVLLYIGHPPPANAHEVPEYRLKVAFLYNFAAYTEWPIPPTQALNLCIYGQDPFGENLDFIRKKKVNGHELVIRHSRNINELSGCQIVFITHAMIDHLTDINSRLGDHPVLTIAETPGAGRQGAILNMAVRDGKIVFEANIAAAKTKGLKLSSQLLRFAIEVYQ